MHWRPGVAHHRSLVPKVQLFLQSPKGPFTCAQSSTQATRMGCRVLGLGLARTVVTRVTLRVTIMLVGAGTTEACFADAGAPMGWC